MSAWNKFDVFIVILSCAEAIASLVIGQYVNDEINKMEGNTTSSLKILKLFKGMDFILSPIFFKLFQEQNFIQKSYKNGESPPCCTNNENGETSSFLSDNRTICDEMDRKTNQPANEFWLRCRSWFHQRY